ncbi:hypothetical protein ABFS83_14G069900 [Erythranthe nasuta]
MEMRFNAHVISINVFFFSNSFNNIWSTRLLNPYKNSGTVSSTTLLFSPSAVTYVGRKNIFGGHCFLRFRLWRHFNFNHGLHRWISCNRIKRQVSCFIICVFINEMNTSSHFDSA